MGRKAAAGLLSVAPVESLSLALIRQEVGVRRLMPQWVRGRNVVQFPFRGPLLEMEIPMVVSGQLLLTIDYLALKDIWIIKSWLSLACSLSLHLSHRPSCISSASHKFGVLYTSPEIQLADWGSCGINALILFFEVHINFPCFPT